MLDLVSLGVLRALAPCLLAVCLFVAPASRANSLANPGFETGDLSGWSTGGTSTQFGVGTDGQLLLVSGVDPRPFLQNVRSGQFAANAVVRTNPLERLILSQTVSVLPSTNYDVGFWLGMSTSDPIGVTVGDARMQISIDGLGLLPDGSFILEPGSTPADFVEIGGSFNSGASTSITVSFAITGSGSARAAVSFDDFYLAVPEPGTGILFGAGLLALWWARFQDVRTRSRRRSRAAS